MSSARITDTFKQVKSNSSRQNEYGKPVADLSVTKRTKNISENKVKTVDEVEFAILRSFDLQAKYGPCIGIKRMERWERADKFGLYPPEEVKKIIEKNGNNDQYTECVWYGYNI